MLPSFPRFRKVQAVEDAEDLVAGELYVRIHLGLSESVSSLTTGPLPAVKQFAGPAVKQFAGGGGDVWHAVSGHVREDLVRDQGHGRVGPGQPFSKYVHGAQADVRVCAVQGDAQVVGDGGQAGRVPGQQECALAPYGPLRDLADVGSEDLVVGVRVGLVD